MIRSGLLDSLLHRLLFLDLSLLLVFSLSFGCFHDILFKSFVLLSKREGIKGEQVYLAILSTLNFDSLSVSSKGRNGTISKKVDLHVIDFY